MRRAVSALLIGLLTITTPMGVAMAQETGPGPGPEVHVVEPGDSIHRVADQYGVDPQDLAEYNDIDMWGVLRVGTELRIPGTLHTAEMAAGYWTILPGETLYYIARQTGTTVAALISYNSITNPNIIRDYTELQIPPAGFVPTPEPTPEITPTTTPSETTSTTTSGTEETTPVVVAPPPASVPSGAVSVTFDPVLYSGDGRMAEVMITVTNNSVQPAVAGGRWYIERDPLDGGLQWITLIGAVHETIPYPQITTETLWHATVYTDDGMIFPAYAGCRYVETVFAEGDESDHITDEWFHWTMTLYGGWFDCGNAYQVKPEDLAPGESATVPLTIYLVHPRDWGRIWFGDRRITRIDLELFDSNGHSLGTVASVTYP